MQRQCIHFYYYSQNVAINWALILSSLFRQYYFIFSLLPHHFTNFPIFNISLLLFLSYFHNLVPKSTGITYDWCDPPKGLGTFDIILAFEWYVLLCTNTYTSFCCFVVKMCISYSFFLFSYGILALLILHVNIFFFLFFLFYYLSHFFFLTPFCMVLCLF